MTCSGSQGILVFQDSATIPCVLFPVRQQIGGLIRVLLLVTIPVSTLFLWFKMRGGERIFGELVRILVVILGLIGYDEWFTDGVTVVGLVAQSLYPTSLVLAFYEKVWQSNLLPGSIGSFLSFLSDPMGILYLILLDGLKVIVLAFSLVRYALLSFLYIVGPLLFAVAVIPGLFFLVSQWARNALEISLWLLFHNLLIGIFSSINLYQSLSTGPTSTTLTNRVLEIGILLVLVLMILFVPILTHLLLDRSYEGIGSFVGPQAEAMGRTLWHNMLAKPLLKGELPFGMGEFKSGTTTKDIGQGRRVYRKKQLRIGPMDFTSMVWQRTGSKKSANKGEEERSTVRESEGSPAPKGRKAPGGPAKRTTKKAASGTTSPRPRKKAVETAQTLESREEPNPVRTRRSRKKAAERTEPGPAGDREGEG
jgi:hypothetical protein